MTEATRNHWMSLLAQTRDAFNACTKMVTSANTPLSLVSVHALCYDVLRKQFPQVPSQGIIRVQKSVLAMLRSMRGNKHKDASVPQMKSLVLQLDKRLYSNLSVNGISIIQWNTTETWEMHVCTLWQGPWAVQHLYSERPHNLRTWRKIIPFSAIWSSILALLGWLRNRCWPWNETVLRHLCRQVLCW